MAETGTRNLGLPQNTRRLHIVAPYPDRVGSDWLAPYDLVEFAENWRDVYLVDFATPLATPQELP